MYHEQHEETERAKLLAMNQDRRDARTRPEPGPAASRPDYPSWAAAATGARYTAPA